MKRGIAVVAGLTAALIGFSAGPAAAWDCIRFIDEKTFEKGNQSPNWEYASLDMVVADGVAQGFVTQEQADCVVEHWVGDGVPEYFAFGVGVAGANGAMKSGKITEDDFFVLAPKMAEANRADGHGIDHFEALLGKYMGQCMEEVPEHQH